MKSDQKKKKGRGYARSSFVIPAFLFKTYEILENPENFEIISWNEEGNAFIVKKVNEFADQVLPKYFKHNNYASFVRQLNMYDFHKTRQESSENEFKHKLFRRGYKYQSKKNHIRNLLCQIKRKTSETSTTLSLVPSTIRNISTKHPQENQFIMEEMLNLRNKQEDLEKVCQILLGQNHKLLSENNMLWNQLIKNKSKNERRLEKIILWIVGNALEDGHSNQSSESPSQKRIEDYKEKEPNRDKNEKTKSFIRLVQELKGSNDLVHHKKLRKNRSRRYDGEEDNDDIYSQLKKIKINSNLIQSLQAQKMIEDEIPPPQLCLENAEFSQPLQFDRHLECNTPPVISSQPLSFEPHRQQQFDEQYSLLNESRLFAGYPLDAPQVEPPVPLLDKSLDPFMNFDSWIAPQPNDRRYPEENEDYDNFL